jgi:hypothetical protein
MSMAAVATAYDPSRLPSAETQTVHEGGIKPYYVSKINQLKVRVPFHHNTHTQTLTHTHTCLDILCGIHISVVPSPSPLSLPMRPTTAAMPSDTSQHTLQNSVWRTSCPALHAFLSACVGIWRWPNTRQSLMWLNCSFHPSCQLTRTYPSHPSPQPLSCDRRFTCYHYQPASHRGSTRAYTLGPVHLTPTFIIPAVFLCSLGV